jgi:phosphatidylserine/phosphatidylglycerophosphate/cardiolipin synthase-like enzyme
MPPQDPLIRAISRLAEDLPAELAERIATDLEAHGPTGWPQLRRQVMRSVAHASVHKQLEQLLDVWETQAPPVDATAVALALRAAAQTAVYQRQQQKVELVWTGPDTGIVPLRRTDQALLQLIREAEETLHIVSFAVYKVTAVAQALVAAAARGVRICIYLETPEASAGRMSNDPMRALGKAVTASATIFIWPREQRTAAGADRVGALHAKVALADARTLLISSANLTQHAMTLNMEMGLIVRGGPLPAQVAAHLARLVDQGVFRPL